MVFSSAPLAQRLWGRPAAELSHPLLIPARDRDAPIPLSFSQQPMWLAETLDPDTALYNSAEAFRLTGPLDERALRFALNAIVRRHEILRTGFTLAGGEPVQTVFPDGAFPLDVVDRTGLDGGTQALQERCAEFIGQPHDFVRGRLARALLIRLGSQEHVLVLAIHHIVRDGWTLGVLLREIGAHMRAFALGSAPDLPALTVQYGDFCIWQHRLAADGAYDRQRDYWVRRLADAPASLDVAGDRPRPARTEIAGRTQIATIERATVDALRAVAAGASASFFMTLMAAFQVLLHRYSGESDVLTGFPVAGRVLPETEPMVGCFINTCVLRTTFEPGASFLQLLAQVRREALDAYANQDLPFERLVRALRPERRVGQNPIVQTLVTLIDPRRPKLEIPGVVVKPVYVARGTAKVDLGLELEERPEGLVCRLEHSSALYDDVSAVRMLEHFGRLLRAIASDPDQRVDTLPLLEPDERHTMVHAWNPRIESTDARCTHELLEEWAARSPDAIAVESPGTTLTYAELDRRAELLAHRLRRAGARPGALVGIFLDRSPELVIAILAVLKAGAGYLPLDTAYPVTRVAFLIANAGVRIVVTTGTAAQHDGLGDTDRVLVGESDQSGEPPSVHDARERATPSDLAYVIYTSGTTGTPKGVMLEHRAVVAYLRAMTTAYAITPADRVLQFSSPSFDVSIKEIFGALASGATLVLRTDAMLASPDTFLKACGQWRITFLSVATAYWHDLAAAIDAGEATLPASVRTVVFGAETVSAPRVVRWQEQLGGAVALFNAYGPTETTVASTRFEIPPAAQVARFASIPIGRPLANSRCYVLDPSGEPAPVNVPGDLYIGGASLARGYLGDPALTAERFVADPFDPPHGRMYRTGDRARYFADGTIDFLGRVDRQLKIRGYRIEPGEIESALLQHPAVREAVVDADVDPAGAKHLIAFVTSAGAQPASSAELVDLLRAALPPHMVPARIITIDAIPMTANMKADHSALRALSRSSRAEPALHVAPQSPIECALAAMWSEVLQVERVGLSDDFFALGGHSLLGAALIARINERFGTTIPLRRLFEDRTVHALSVAVIASRAGAPARDALVALLDELEASAEVAGREAVR